MTEKTEDLQLIAKALFPLISRHPCECFVWIDSRGMLLVHRSVLQFVPVSYRGEPQLIYGQSSQAYDLNKVMASLNSSILSVTRRVPVCEAEHFCDCMDHAGMMAWVPGSGVAVCRVPGLVLHGMPRVDEPVTRGCAVLGSLVESLFSNVLEFAETPLDVVHMATGTSGGMPCRIFTFGPWESKEELFRKEFVMVAGNTSDAFLPEELLAKETEG